ncbi:MAG: hypothetical protein WCO92_03350, partial [Verrucomicrobiota bacterium]
MQGPETPLVPGRNYTMDQFRTALPAPDHALRINPAVLHGVLKNFKQGKINIQTTAGFRVQVAWSEKDQRFDPVAISLATAMTDGAPSAQAASSAAVATIGVAASRLVAKSFAAVLTGGGQPFSPPIAAQEDSMASDLAQDQGDETVAVSPAEEIAQKLNEYEAIDRRTRRADASQLDLQNPQGFR